MQPTQSSLEKKKKVIQNILHPKKAASVILLKCRSDHVTVLFKTLHPCPVTLGCDGIGRKETLARNFGPSYFSYHMSDYPQYWSALPAVTFLLVLK